LPAEPPKPSIEQVAPQEVPAPEPAEEMPEETPPAAPPEEMPEEPATPAKPADDVEDLFKDTDAGDKKAAASPANATPDPADNKADDVDDLFKDTDDKKAAAIQPAAAQLASDRELEDLFIEPTAVAPRPKTRPVKTAKQVVEARHVEILPAAHVAPAAESSNAMRTWTDNTGKYRINARLVIVGEGSVRLLKDTGKYTTVPFNRLSSDDLNFVRRQSATSVAGKF
jgi:hypothetical protein